MGNFEIMKSKEICKNLTYNGNKMICSIDVNELETKKVYPPLSQSKCFTCLKPQQKHSTVNNFKNKYDF